jgi:hypothetical protein
MEEKIKRVGFSLLLDRENPEGSLRSGTVP